MKCRLVPTCLARPAPKPGFRRALAFALPCLLASLVRAQADGTAAPAASAAAPDQPVQMSAFEIKGESDTNYVGRTALSSTRIAEDISDIPQSVQVLNHSFLQAVDPFMLTDVLDYVGGAQTGQLDFTTGRLNFRGFTGDGDYMDGFAPPAQFVLDSAIYDRFEIIKGPSTIFLAADGAPGGVLNKITKNPLSEAANTLTLQAGLYNANNVSLDSTGPVPFVKDGALLYRVVAAQQYSNGEFGNDTQMHRFTLMPELSYQFNPDTKLELKGFLSNTIFNSVTGLPIDPRTLKVFPFPYDTTESVNNSYPFQTHDRVQRVWANFTSHLNEHVNFRLAAMGAWDLLNETSEQATTFNEGTRTWTVANYNGTQSFPRSVVAEKLYTAYQDLQSDMDFVFKTGPWINHNLLVGTELRNNPSTLTNWPGTTSPWNPYVYQPVNLLVNYTTPSAKSSNENTNARAYVLETLKVFHDRILLSYGLERARATASTQNVLTGAYSTPNYALYKNLKQYGLVLKVLPGVSLFTGYNENFAINGIGIVNGVSGPLPPKTGKQSEVGIKTDLLNHRLSLNASYFDVKQLNNTVPSAPLDPLNPNVLIPGIISRGFDGDESFAVNKNIYLMGSFAYYNAKSIVGPADSFYTQPYYGRVITTSIPVDNTAEHTASLFVLYRFTDGLFDRLSVGLGTNYQSKRAITDGANQVMFGYIPGRTLLNATFSYSTGKHIKYSLNIDNLLNTNYIYSVRNENLIIQGGKINVKLGISYSL